MVAQKTSTSAPARIDLDVRVCAVVGRCWQRLVCIAAVGRRHTRAAAVQKRSRLKCRVYNTLLSEAANLLRLRQRSGFGIVGSMCALRAHSQLQPPRDAEAGSGGLGSVSEFSTCDALGSDDMVGGGDVSGCRPLVAGA